MPSSIEKSRMSRREFLKIIKDTAGVVLLGSLGTTLEACGPKLPDTPIPKSSLEIVGIPIILEMPFGSQFIVETKPPHPRLNLNRTLTQKLLEETVIKPTASIKVSIYPNDWIRVLPDNQLLLIDDQTHQSLPPQEKDTFKDGWTSTLYNPSTGVPQRAAVYIAAGRFLREARRGRSMTVQNEFLPEGINVNPIIALNTVFYHEIRYHALLRNIDYRKLDETGLIKEEREARKGETDWIKNLARKANAVSNDRLFLVPY